MIDPNRLVILRVLWGDSSIDTHAKVLWDIEHRTAGYAAKLDGNVAEVAVVFGTDNLAFLANHGWGGHWSSAANKRLLLMPEELPGAYCSVKGRTRHCGRVQDGVGMNWRKLAAMQYVLWRHASFVYLDWDVIVEKAPDAAMLAMLEAGPVFQARESYCSKIDLPWRPAGKRDRFYTGGCYYCRSAAFVDHAIMRHATACPAEQEEVPLTMAADELLGHDRAIDNERLAVSCVGMRRRGTAPYFRHGTMLTMKKFRSLQRGGCPRGFEQWAKAVVDG